MYPSSNLYSGWKSEVFVFESEIFTLKPETVRLDVGNTLGKNREYFVKCEIFLCIYEM